MECDNDNKNESQAEAARQAFIEAEQRQWLTIEEAASVLRISITIMLQVIHADQIVLFAPGKVRRIHIDSLVQCQKPISEWHDKTVSCVTSPSAHSIRRGRRKEGMS